MKVLIQKKSEAAKMPYKKYDEDYGFDVYATSKEVKGNVYKYGIGLAFEIKMPWWMRMLPIIVGIKFRPRSSVYKAGFILSNCVGTIDQLYRGEVSAVFYKVADGTPYEVGDRIGQIALDFTWKVRFEWADKLSDTSRGDGGYGSTGKN